MIWRISDRRAFQELARAGRRARTKTLWCSYLNDPDAVPLRVAFSVGRSIGPATTRNRLRRRLRMIVGHFDRGAGLTQGPTHGLTHGWLLIGARPPVNQHTFASLRDEVTDLLRRVSSPSSPPPMARRADAP